MPQFRSSMAIPKIIHYCWFGKGEKSALAQSCIASWKQHCPDYEFKLWNEQSSKAYQNQFYKDAMRNKKYAFASDCIRVQVLEEFGGIYLDTDMLLLKSLDELLAHAFFTGFEHNDRAAYGIFGGIPGHRFFKLMTDFYNSERFNRYSPPVITHTFKGVMNKNALKENEKIFPQEVFYALPYQNKAESYKKYTTSNSIAVHLWDHSWQEAESITTWWLVKQLLSVFIDRWVYAYPKSYSKRYLKEFGRKLYYKLTRKQSN